MKCEIEIKESDINFEALKSADLVYIAPLNGESNKVLEPIVEFAHQNNIKICFIVKIYNYGRKERISLDYMQLEWTL